MQIERLGRYEVTGEVGRGAMGVVYKAADPLLDRVVAIKTISLVNSDSTEFEERFFREAKSAGRLNHPNIVTVYDAGKDGDVAYIAMEFLEGREFRSVLADRPPISTEVIAEIIAQVAEGLDYAHQNQVVHRDVKPSNIMVLANNVAKITDFGIALIPSGAKTMTGMILGSPKYMSPEQIVGERVDRRSDVFSLGVVLYESLTGRTPFRGSNVSTIMYKIINEMPELPSALGLQSEDPKDTAAQIYREIPPSLDYIVSKALAKHPEDRYQTAAEFAHDLRHFRELQTPAPPPAEPPRTLERRAGRRSSGDDTLVVHRSQIQPAPARAADGERRLRSDDDTEWPDATIVHRPDDLEATLLAPPTREGIDTVSLDERPLDERPLDAQIEDVADATVFIEHRDDLRPGAAETAPPPAPSTPVAERPGAAASPPDDPLAATDPVLPVSRPTPAPLEASPAVHPATSSAPAASTPLTASTPRRGLLVVIAAAVFLMGALGLWLASGNHTPTPALSTVSTAPPLTPPGVAEPTPAASTLPVPATAPVALSATSIQAVSAAPAEPTEPTEPASSVDPAVIQVAVTPWGEVWVDGENKGVVPPLLSLKLAPGRHVIEIRNPGHLPFVQEYQLKSKTITRIKHKFKG